MRDDRKLNWVAAAVALLVGLMATGTGGAEVGPHSRFYYSGDGVLRLVGEKSGSTFEGRYRTEGGRYDPGALAAIDRVFDAPTPTRTPVLSLRLIEFLDYLQDRLQPDARIAITSGYRPPAYNRRLRDRGGLVAKASLHQYGMAADLKMEGVPARRIWETVKGLGFGGTGYYHGDSVHIDVGPHRWWDEATSGVDTGISDDNKLIGLVTDYDIYRAGETIALRFIRMTAFPIGVSPMFGLQRHEPAGAVAEAAVFRPRFSDGSEGPCPRFETIAQMAGIQWQLPASLPPGRFVIRADFCGNPWPAMPARVFTPPFEIRRP